MKQILILLILMNWVYADANADQDGYKGDGDNSAWSGSSSLSGNGQDNGGVQTNICQDNPTLPQCNPVADNDNTNEPEPTPIPSEDNGLNDIQGAIETKDAKDEADDEKREPGIDATDGKDGATGSEGKQGADGNDGKDADETRVQKLEDDSRKQNEFANDSAAGNSAMSVIDFGSTKKGETFGGIGIGYSNSWYGNSTAGAIGAKHGITDETAGVIKVWSAGSDSYGGGAGVVHKF